MHHFIVSCRFLGCLEEVESLSRTVFSVTAAIRIQYLALDQSDADGHHHPHECRSAKISSLLSNLPSTLITDTIHTYETLKVLFSVAFIKLQR